jgi:hypothetical protein
MKKRISIELDRDMPKKAAIVIALGNDRCTGPDSPAIVSGSSSNSRGVEQKNMAGERAVSDKGSVGRVSQNGRIELIVSI